jgi:hypothetical protein
MGVITLPTDGFAQAGARMGEALMRRMANAQAVVGGVSFAVQFTDRPTNLMVGGVLAQSGRAVVVALAADLPAATVEGAPITIGAEAWTVATEPQLDRRTMMVSFEVEQG